MTSEADLVDLSLLPLERGGDLVVGGGEPLDRVAHLARRGVARSPEGGPFEDAEPDLDLVEPRRVGRGEVEMDVPMTGQPAVVLGLVGTEVVEHDVDLELRVGMSREDVVHDVEELPPAAAGGVARLDEPARDFEGRAESRRAVTLVLVGKARERASVGQAEPALASLERLDLRASHRRTGRARSRVGRDRAR